MLARCIILAALAISACTDDGGETAAVDGGAGTAGDSAASGDAAPDVIADVAAPHDAMADATDAADSAPSSLLFADDFERADTTSGLGNDWVVHVRAGTPPSTFGISDGLAFPFFGESMTAPLFHAVPTAFRPEPFAQDRVRVSVDLVTVGGSYDGLVVLFARSQTQTNEIDDTYFCGFLAAAKKLYIMKLTGGVLDALAISAADVLPLPASSTSALDFTLDGAELSCEISGAVNAKLSATDATFASGHFGMGGGKPNQSHVRFDDFSIETL